MSEHEGGYAGNGRARGPALVPCASGGRGPMGAGGLQIGKRTLVEAVSGGAPHRPGMAGSPPQGADTGAPGADEEARPTLPDGVDYQPLGGGPSLLVRRRWLESDPQWQPGRPSIAPARARELLEHLLTVGVIAWATSEAIARAAKDTQITTSGTGDVVRLHWSAALYGYIGLPTGAPAAVTIVGDAAVVAVSAPDVEVEPGTQIPLAAAQLRALLRALEGATGMAAPPDIAQILDALGAARRVIALGGHGVFTSNLDRATLETLFGRQQVEAWREARRSVGTRA